MLFFKHEFILFYSTLFLILRLLNKKYINIINFGLNGSFGFHLKRREGSKRPNIDALLKNNRNRRGFSAKYGQNKITNIKEKRKGKKKGN